MDKTAILEKVIEKLDLELSTMVQAAKDSKEAAVGEESKAENKYDTRGLEASYLAGAQAKRAVEIQDLITLYKGTKMVNFDKGSEIGVTAVIEVDDDGEKKMYFMAPKEGGQLVEHGGQSFFVLSPQSPIGKALMGRKSGDDIEVEIKGEIRELEITNVW